MIRPRDVILFLLEALAIATLLPLPAAWLMAVALPGLGTLRAPALGLVLGAVAACPLLLWRFRERGLHLSRREPQGAARALRHPLFLAVGVALAGLGLSLTLGLHARADAAANAQARFDSLSERMVSETTRRVNQIVFGLRGARGVYAASRSVEREEFHAYCDSRDLPQEFPGALGLGVIERVARGDLDTFLAREQADGAPDLKVTTSGESPELWVIKHCFPRERNQAAWGVDLGTNPHARAALELAVATGEATLTAPIPLVQDERRRSGFLYCLPIYRHGANPTTPQQRLEDLVGVVFAPLLLDDALRTASHFDEGLLDLEIFDGSPQGPTLFDLDGHLARAAEHRPYDDRLFVRTEPMAMGGRTWAFTTSTTPAFDEGVDRTTPALLGVGGALLSLLAAVAVWSLASSHRRAVALAGQMTLDLTRLARQNVEARLAAEQAFREVEALRSALDRHSILSIADRDGRILEVNAGFCEISGYTPQELLGRDHRIVNSGLHPRAFWERMWRTITSGSAWRGEVRNRAKDGSYFWVDSTIVPVRGADGQIEKYVSIRFDVTARKAAGEQIARLAAIVDSTDDAIVSKTLGGVITTWNHGAQKLFGFTAEQALGRNIAIIIPPELQADEAMILEMMCRGETIRSLQTVRRRADGSTVQVAATFSPLVDESGSIVGISKIARDITEQKRVQAELIRSRLEAEAASRSKSEFLANMSHEIRTPMTAILGYADLLLDDGDMAASPHRRLECINTIRRNGEHLLTIINDILDLSKIEAGKMTVESVPTATATLVHDTLVLMQVRAAAKGLDLTASLDTPVPPTILSDPVRLRQILMNLIGNAIKFTAHGSVHVHVSHLPNAPRGPALRFDIQDTGIGLSPDQIGRLFGAFVQADASTTRKFGGTGLGLRISKRLAQMLGGDIAVTSTEGLGSTFSLTIAAPSAAPTGDPAPAPMLPPGPLGAAATERDHGPRAAAATPAQPLRGVRILLAEDGADNTRLIAHHLARAGATVQNVENGRLAVELLSADGTVAGPLRDPPPVDLFISDMQMPEMDGYEAARTLRAKGFTLPIIAMTAHAMSGDEQKCVDAGCTHYVTKPIDKHRLIEVCVSALGPRAPHEPAPTAPR